MSTSSLNICCTSTPSLPFFLFLLHNLHIFVSIFSSARCSSFKSPCSLFFSFSLSLSLSHPPYLSIFTHYPLLLLLLLFVSCTPLPPSLWLSSSDRLLMQALYESISPSAVVELAPLLSLIGISSSALQLHPGLLYACVDESI